MFCLFNSTVFKLKILLKPRKNQCKLTISTKIKSLIPSARQPSTYLKEKSSTYLTQKATSFTLTSLRTKKSSNLNLIKFNLTLIWYRTIARVRSRKILHFMDLWTLGKLLTNLSFTKWMRIKLGLPLYICFLNSSLSRSGFSRRKWRDLKKNWICWKGKRIREINSGILHPMSQKKILKSL